MGEVRALVLCGGKGKRLRPLTYYIQKTMIPVGYSQNPLLEYIVRLLKFHGLSEITFLVDYRAKQIENYFGDGTRFGVKLDYLYDADDLGGTGGSVINAFRGGAFKENDTVLVYYGDILTNMNLRHLIEFHRDKEAKATVALASGFEVRVGVAEMGNGGLVHGFIEKPVLEKPVSIGILAFEGSALKKAQKLVEENPKVDLMGDIIPFLMSAGDPVFGFISGAFWYDVGSIETYEKLDNEKVKSSMAFLF
jgi:mannose-1-phosphate guanylyltransferase